MAEAGPENNAPDLLIDSDQDDDRDTDFSSGQYVYKQLERSQSEAALLQGKSYGYKGGSTETELHTDQHNISECSKVYFDLSKGETFEEHNGTHTIFAHSRSSSGRFLETIRQDQELRVNDMTLNYRGPSSSLGSTSSVDSADGTITKAESDQGDGQGTEDSGSLLQVHFETFSNRLRQKSVGLKAEFESEQINSLNEINMLIEQAWTMPAIGRDLAYALSAMMRQEKALDIVVKNCESKSKPLLSASVRLLDQVMTTGNREHICHHRLESVLQMCTTYRDDRELSRMITGILESLFKTSEETCLRVIQHGGLDVILYWCRSQDRLTLRHCAIALSNLALYGGQENHSQMISHKVPEWLFPLAFNKDDSVRYYACLAISVLVANKYDKKIEEAVINSGTLELVLPFINSHSPMEFARMDQWHRHGRSKEWLQRLVPLLSSKREEPQALAAFHFAMEAGIKSEQGRKQMFQEIDAVEPLKKIASSSPSATASKLASEALSYIGEAVPHKLSLRVPLWCVEDVVHWVAQVGFNDCESKFQACQVDGDLLLMMTDDDLVDSINVTSCLTRKRFMRELRELKCSCDYSSCDPTQLDHWLKKVSPDLSQYTYQLLFSGVDRNFLPQVTEENLRDDCGILNGVHRTKLLQKIREDMIRPTCGPSSQDLTDGQETYTSDNKTIDAFISYRRINGAQLASLLKVHLQLRGYSVFLDIERLKAGKFDEGLLTSIAHSKNFILVLTTDALERCVEDTEGKDWVHREIVAALESKCNIIPLTDNFHWPLPETLPEDMRQLCFFNGIKWIHDYQDACVDKLERFLKGEKKASVHGLGSSFDDSSPHGASGDTSIISKPRKGLIHSRGSSFEDSS